MKFLAIIITTILMHSSYAKGVVEVAKSRCDNRLATDFLYSDDFSWGMTLSDAQVAFDKVYHSDKRLKDRVFFNGKNFVFPYRYQGESKDIKINETFIKSIIKHVESALERKYVDFIIFPDMGHSHFFIPKKFYNEVLSPIPVSNNNIMYEKMFAHPELKILYHTAEQLKMKEGDELINDRHIQWRFYTRNLVGDNKAQGHMELIHAKDNNANTARDYKDNYKYWGAGFNISANRNGCFPYQYNGKTYYFDLSLKDLEPSSTNSDDWTGM